MMNMSVKHAEIPESKNPFSRKWTSQTEFSNVFTGLQFSTSDNTSQNLMTTPPTIGIKRRKIVKRPMVDK